MDVGFGEIGECEVEGADGAPVVGVAVWVHEPVVLDGGDERGRDVGLVDADVRRPVPARQVKPGYGCGTGGAGFQMR